MASVYSQVYFHIVFSTKGRTQYIIPEIDNRLYPYIGGIAKQNDISLISKNGTTDHIHLLCGIPPRMSISDVVRIIKSNTSKWIHESMDKQAFAWQTGYSVFSVSHSNIEAVSQYIDKQKDHHAKVSYKDELLALLKKHNIEFDERYLLG